MAAAESERKRMAAEESESQRRTLAAVDSDSFINIREAVRMEENCRFDLRCPACPLRPHGMLSWGCVAVTNTIVVKRHILTTYNYQKVLFTLGEVSWSDADMQTRLEGKGEYERVLFSFSSLGCYANIPVLTWTDDFKVQGVTMEGALHCLPFEASVRLERAHKEVTYTTFNPRSGLRLAVEGPLLISIGEDGRASARRLHEGEGRSDGGGGEDTA